MPELTVDAQVGAIRAFNRFYTRKIGVVDGMASSPFALAEARVLYELAHREQATATDIRKELGLDAGYMSRILREFERRKLIRREQSKTDERQKIPLPDRQGTESFCAIGCALQSRRGCHPRRTFAHKAEATRGCGAGGSQTAWR